MNDPEPDRLARDVLADASLDRVRERSLAAGVGLLRRKRRRRTLIAAGTAAAAVAFAFALAISRPQPHAPAPEVPAAKRPIVRIIGDDELLARFAERPVVLVGAPGRQRLVFLDEKTRATGRD